MLYTDFRGRRTCFFRAQVDLPCKHVILYYMNTTGVLPLHEFNSSRWQQALLMSETPQQSAVFIPQHASRRLQDVQDALGASITNDRLNEFVSTLESEIISRQNAKDPAGRQTTGRKPQPKRFRSHDPSCEEPLPKRAYRCMQCGQEGHTRLSKRCPKRVETKH